MGMGEIYFDTHCHIHSTDYPLDQSAVIAAARNDGVRYLLCVGTDLEDSEQAAEFVAGKKDMWASAGIHPHEAARYTGKKHLLDRFACIAALPQVVAIGEAGLDYYYNHSPKEDQLALLEFQIELAIKNKKPMIFHVRDAFEDFWPIFDKYTGLTGVVHSFTATKTVLEQIQARGLYVGLNGITTFMKPGEQLEAIKAVPLENMVLETDAPFLTPVPFRGKMNESKYVKLIAKHIADLKGEDVATIAHVTTSNAKKLFNVE